MNLDDVLGDKPIERPAIVEPTTDEKPVESPDATAAAPSAVETVEKPTESTQRDEKGRFATKPEEKPEPMVPLSALLAERARRKEPEQAKPKTSIFDDEDKGVRERVEDHVEPLRAEIFNLKLQLAKSQPGFDDAVMAFLKAAQNDAVLKHQADTAPDPLAFIYREGKRIKELADVDGDIEKYRDKVVSQEKVKYSELETKYKALEAENKALKESQEKRAKVPHSLNSEQSAVSNSEQFAGPRPLKSILG